MKIAIVAAEISPWAKAGGLADVIGAFPVALKKLGADPVLILPGYRSILRQLKTTTIAEVAEDHFGHGVESFPSCKPKVPPAFRCIWSGTMAFLIARASTPSEANYIYDNVMRYIFFGRAAAAIAANYVHPDLLHAHDWHAAAATIMMKADDSVRAKMRDAVSVYTIHNLAYQGVFDPVDYALLGIDWSYYTVDGLEFFDHVNLMKGAVMMSDAASTVSPSYAAEATSDPDYGFGLEGVLRQ